jgi:hypothetical protein
MPRVGFVPMAPVCERAKTVHASDRAATVIGITTITNTTSTININNNKMLEKTAQ